MVRLSFTIELKYEVFEQPAHFLLHIHAARTPLQAIASENLTIDPPAEHVLHEDPVHGNRTLRLNAGPGPVSVRYEATVDLHHEARSPALVEEVPVAAIPPGVVEFVHPSRYCQSDRLRRIASREFGHLRPGYWRVLAIRDWVRARTVFTPGSTNSSTSAVDTMIEQVGVCRDFAHLMIALCRALNIPARFATSIDYGAPPELGPPDFHAFVEVFLGDRWYMFDPTGITAPMGLVRIGTGRDAADVSFATLFGTMKSNPPVVSIVAMDDPSRGYHLPRHSTQALSVSEVVALQPASAVRLAAPARTAAPGSQ